MTAAPAVPEWADPERVEEVARRLCSLDIIGRSRGDPDAPYFAGTPYIHRGGFLPASAAPAQPLWTAYAEDARRALRVICCPPETEL